MKLEGRCPNCCQELPDWIIMEEAMDASLHTDDCLEWPHFLKNGYGQLKSSVHSSRKAHRVLLELYLGRSIAEGKVVMHICDNKSCINPRHLKEGTQAENVRDYLEKRHDNMERA